MKFDNKIYKAKWGKLYIILFNILALCIVLFSIILDLILYSVLINNADSEEYANQLLIIVCLVEFIMLVINYYALFKKKGRAKKLNILFGDNKLYIGDTIKHGLSFDTYNPFQTISYDYLISNIEGWKKDNRWYYLSGVFEPVMTIDGVSYESNKVMTRLRIPIVFDNQEYFESILTGLIPVLNL